MSSIRNIETKRRRGRTAAAGLSVLIGTTASACAADDTGRNVALPDGPSGVISVIGFGEANAVPDQAMLRFAVEARAPTASAAMAGASNSASAILGFLANQRIERRAISTSSIQLSAEYDYSSTGREPRVTGYVAFNGMTVRLDDATRAGAIIDGVIGAGANRLDGVEFAFASPQPLLEEARRAAIKDAQRKAALFAAEAGVTLGPVISIVEAGASGPAPVMMARMKADAMVMAAPPIEPGESSLAASVNVTFSIK